MPLQAFALTPAHIRQLTNYCRSAKLSPAPHHPAIYASSTPRRLAQKSAVLMPLCNVDNVASVLFTLRSAHISTHAAQVSFPGGHLESDETPEHASLREFKEETGLDGAVAIATWHPLRAVTGTLVVPVLGAVLESDLVSVRNLDQAALERASLVSPAEVSRVFSVPLHRLCTPSEWTEQQLARGITAPRMETSVAPIWGLTALFADYMIKDFIKPGLGL